MSDDLSLWLLEQIAEDEQIARLASPGPWSTESGLHVLDQTGEHAPVRQAGSFEDGWHIARWDPGGLAPSGVQSGARPVHRHRGARSTQRPNPEAHGPALRRPPGLPRGVAAVTATFR